MCQSHTLHQHSTHQPIDHKCRTCSHCHSQAASVSYIYIDPVSIIFCRLSCLSSLVLNCIAVSRITLDRIMQTLNWSRRNYRLAAKLERTDYHDIKLKFTSLQTSDIVDQTCDSDTLRKAAFAELATSTREIGNYSFTLPVSEIGTSIN